MLGYPENRDTASLSHAVQCFSEKGQVAIPGNTKVFGSENIKVLALKTTLRELGFSSLEKRMLQGNLIVAF